MKPHTDKSVENTKFRLYTGDEGRNFNPFNTNGIAADTLAQAYVLEYCDQVAQSENITRFLQELEGEKVCS